MGKRLSELKKGKSAVIMGFADNEISLKLMEMGCLPGEIVKMQKSAPLGDPMSIKISGYTLTLRKKEAAVILVEEN